MTPEILHLAPFEPQRYPPLLNTLRLCNRLGARSLVLASTPRAGTDVFGLAPAESPAVELSGPAQLRFLLSRATQVLLRRKVDLVIAHNVRGLAIGGALSVLARRLVYHCHDFEGEVGFRRVAMQSAEVLGSLRAAEIWVPNRERVELGRARGLRGEFRIVRNYPLKLQSLPVRGALREWLRDKSVPQAHTARIVVRHGRIGPAHCIVETIRALPSLDADAHFVIIGDGDHAYIEQCKHAAQELGVGQRVHWHPFVPHHRLNELLIDADLAMCLYSSEDLNSAAPAPNKVYECLALGVPVLVTAGNSVGDEVEQLGAGLAVEANVDGITSGLRDCLGSDDVRARLSAAARQAHLDRINYETQHEQTILGTLLSARPPASVRSGR